MSVDELIAVIILIGAYGVTWFLFLESMKVVRIIHNLKLTNLDQIKEKLLKRKRPK